MKYLSALILTLFTFLVSMGQETTGAFTCAIINQYSYQYILQKPADTKQLKPLIIFLHGSGEKGTDLSKVKVHGPLKYIQNHTLDAFILAPQCPENAVWEPKSLHKLIEKIVSENKIDTNRIYLTGLSMGAWGVWNLAEAYPNAFAAVVAISGFVDRVPMVDACKMKNLPVKIYHGLLDNVVNPFYSEDIYKRLKNCGADVSLTIFDDAGHDAWTRVYDDPKTYEWMFQHIKK